MPSLDRNLRKDLESAVKKARRAAEGGARQTIEQLAVHHHEPWGTLSPAQRQLRNRLRAHGRQLGDSRDERTGVQAIDRLVGECAYEHWHRLLFARFLAENDLLVEPASSMPLSLDECRELARERSVDWLVLASDFAQRMLPQIFRAGDPVLDVMLPPEKRQELEALLEALPRDVFVADDSLGWVYQFWQSEQKDAVNKSPKKVGADELPAVTQLFTEDYMVLFLLHNTLGAWWVGKVLTARPELAHAATSENELRMACGLRGVTWEYLRFAKDDEGRWHPGAGVFAGWPTATKVIRVLDPCMGSGHFLVFALPILVAFRESEESLSREAAVDAVLQDNLFGLELDPRCTQIAAFNLALAAWKLAGYRPLPAMNLACSGLCPNTKKDDWRKLAGNVEQLRSGMDQLYELFQKAPELGSLINPRALGGDLLVAAFHQLQPFLEKALAREVDDAAAHELAVTARGVSKAAEILSGTFTLIATNVPYLGRGKQGLPLKEYCEATHAEAKADLATCFVERCLAFCAAGATAALVTPQSWLFLSSYKRFRVTLLRKNEWNVVVRLGPNAFRDMNWWAATTSMQCLTARTPTPGNLFAAVDASKGKEPEDKAVLLPLQAIACVSQRAQLNSSNATIVFEDVAAEALLSSCVDVHYGSKPGQTSRVTRYFWELPAIDRVVWMPMESTPSGIGGFTGKAEVCLTLEEIKRRGIVEFGVRGSEAWGRQGFIVSKMNTLPVANYCGEFFDDNTYVLVPKRKDDATSVYAFLTNPEYRLEVRKRNQKVAIDTEAMIQVPFDPAKWRRLAAETGMNALPRPQSTHPTQWLFSGHPCGSDSPLHVAVARLAGYRWPRQTGAIFLDCPAVDLDRLEKHGDDDGIVCLVPLRGELSAADRVRALLAEAFAAEWSPQKLSQMLESVGFGGRSLEEWLRDGFFEQHCELFRNRPFVMQVWDGLKDGFSALVNYHRLAAPNGAGRRTLEKLIYTYLGDWIDRQRADQKNGTEGADARVASAEQLKRELEKIRDGEPPYDIFVRWKPLQCQPVGWEPDLDDGVSVNVRPFMTAKPLNGRGRNACILRVAPAIKWEKGRGKEPSRPKSEYPWFWGWSGQTLDFLGGSTFDGVRWNDLHYSRAAKLAARERAKERKS